MKTAAPRPKPRAAATRTAKRHAQNPQPDLEAAAALAVRLPHAVTLRLILVGCGGTGSWLAPAVVRLARAWQEHDHRRVSVDFVDPDHIEAKNIWRQNFCGAEVGQNKAEALALRYSTAWGFPITAWPCPYASEFLYADNRAEVTILLGCVDNGSARRSLATSVGHLGYRNVPTVWWIDAANSRSSGQVLVGSGNEPRSLAHAFGLGDYCSALPSPSMQHPELLDTQPDAVQAEPGDCADLAIQHSQSLTINQIMAAHTADILNRLVSGHLMTFATYLTLAAGTVHSRPITPRQVAKVAGVRVTSISRLPKQRPYGG
jgi:PRTRC genetic system ThiF family protein